MHAISSAQESDYNNAQLFFCDYAWEVLPLYTYPSIIIIVLEGTLLFGQ